MHRIVILIASALCLSAPAAADPVKPDTPEQAAEQVESAEAEVKVVEVEAQQIPPLPITQGYLNLEEAEDFCTMWIKRRRDVRTCTVIVAMGAQEQRERWAWNLPDPWDKDLDQVHDRVDAYQSTLARIDDAYQEHMTRIWQLERRVNWLEQKLAEERED